MSRVRVWAAARAASMTLILLGFAGIARAEKVEGILMDRTSSERTRLRVVTGSTSSLQGGLIEAYVYTRKEALTPDAQRSGYGIVTFDNEFLTFDAAGNRLALQALRTTTRNDYLKVEVDGAVKGDRLEVRRLKFID